MAACISCFYFSLLEKNCAKGRQNIHQNSPNCTDYESRMKPPVEDIVVINKSSFEEDLDKVLRDMRSFLVMKNKTYGDSALNPVRIFSKCDLSEQLKVRIDDELSRFARGSKHPGDDDEKDLCRYLILLMIARSKESRSSL